MGLGAFYTDDAYYTWKVGHHMEFAAQGRQDIIDHVLGFEMVGFEGWTYPYQKVVIDDSRGEIVGYWLQVTPFEDGEGRRIQTNGRGAPGSAMPATSSGVSRWTCSTWTMCRGS